MAFIMAAFRKKPEWGQFILLASLAVLAACSDQSEGKRFELTRIDAEWSNGRINVTCEQQLALSSEAREALVHGVPLTIDLELTLRDAASQVRVVNETDSHEIRYLPLSDHYQLTHAGSGAVKTFPRLRHVLADLAKLTVSFETGVLPSGDYELLARTRLDQKSMPLPMRLPVLLSAKWQHDSSWSSWPLEVKPGA
jgi:hypothetical protein